MNIVVWTASLASAVTNGPQYISVSYTELVVDPCSFLQPSTALLVVNVQKHQILFSLYFCKAGFDWSDIVFKKEAEYY